MDYFLSFVNYVDYFLYLDYFVFLDYFVYLGDMGDSILSEELDDSFWTILFYGILGVVGAFDWLSWSCSKNY